MKAEGIAKDKQTKEVEAESCAFCVCNYFGLDTSDYSFPYIAGWSSGREMAELKSSMDMIRQTAGEFIDSIEVELIEVMQQQTAEQVVEKDEALEEPSKETITFYVAECLEFPVMGEYHEGLSMDEALKLYDDIPDDRINGIKGIGIHIYTL